MTDESGRNHQEGTCEPTTQRAKLHGVLPGERTHLTRRDLVKGAAKVGAAGAAVAWVAPKFESVAYAAGTTGSPISTTTSSSTSTTEGGTPNTPTCVVDPKVVRFALPFRIRLIGTLWAPTSRVSVTLVGVRNLGSITTNPDGSFDTRLEVPAGVASGQYQIEFSGFDQQGQPHRCFTALEISGTTDGQGGTTTSTATGSGGVGDQGAGTGQPGSTDDGTLPFTGTDSRTLLLIGTGAVVAGRSLYALRSRIAAASADGDAHAR